MVEPVAALRAALIYRLFLDRIEAGERAYHVDDVPAMLYRARPRPPAAAVIAARATNTGGRVASGRAHHDRQRAARLRDHHCDR